MPRKPLLLLLRPYQPFGKHYPRGIRRLPSRAPPVTLDVPCPPRTQGTRSLTRWGRRHRLPKDVPYVDHGPEDPVPYTVNEERGRRRGSNLSTSTSLVSRHMTRVHGPRSSVPCHNGRGKIRAPVGLCRTGWIQGSQLNTVQRTTGTERD